MHAVENFIMSRYQMYWQIYFHPVSRGGEVLLNNCLKRVKQLYMKTINLKCIQKNLFHFEGTVITIDQYVELDEVTVLFYLKKWIHEEDEILSDLRVDLLIVSLSIFHLMVRLLQLLNYRIYLLKVTLTRNIILLVKHFQIYHMIMMRPGSNRQPIHLLRKW